MVVPAFRNGYETEAAATGPKNKRELDKIKNMLFKNTSRPAGSIKTLKEAYGRGGVLSSYDGASSSPSSGSGDGNFSEKDFEKNRLVLRYPDGTFSYAFKSDDPSCWMEIR